MIHAGSNKVGIIILAAGLGTRMNSDKAKVLHKVHGKPMILYVVKTSYKAVGNNIIVVVGHQAETVKKIVSEKYDVQFALQTQQKGTGHAVMQAIPYLSHDFDDIIVLCGDVPLISKKTLEDLIKDHRKYYRDITVIGVNLENPTGYGRLILDENKMISRITEEADADESQKKIKTINTGIYCVKKEFLIQALPEIKSDNAQGEYYFTDIVEIGHRKEKIIGALLVESPEQFIGVNTITELEVAEQAMNRIRNRGIG